MRSLSGRKKKLRMYWGEVFIWEREKIEDVLGWGLSWRKKKLRMYWGEVFILEKEKIEDVLGWGLYLGERKN